MLKIFSRPFGAGFSFTITMRKPLLLLLLANFSFQAVSFAQALPQPLRWGSSRADVLSTQKRKPAYLSESSITFDSIKVDEVDVKLTCNFKNNKLSDYQYSANVPASDSAKLMQAFKSFIGQAITDIGEYHAITEDNNPSTKLVFESDKTRAIMFSGRTKPDQLSMNAFYYDNKPTVPSPSKKPRMKKG